MNRRSYKQVNKCRKSTRKTIRRQRRSRTKFGKVLTAQVPNLLTMPQNKSQELQSLPMDIVPQINNIKSTDETISPNRTPESYEKYINLIREKRKF